jgi:transposase
VERQVHIQEKLRCRCGETILTADGAPKVFDKARYGPGFMAHLAVAKCADAIPLHRLAKQFRRSGVPLNRSTLVDLFHRSAEILAPLSNRLLEHVAQNEIVQADETTLRVQARRKTRVSWLWTFLANEAAATDENEHKALIGFVYSKSRSGETPVKVLGNTVGKLVTDKYSAYNKVLVPGGRERAGCLAHVRRRFFDALPTAPAAQHAMDLILEVYRVERIARDQGILGTPEHLALRQARSRAVMAELKSWLEAEQPKHLPRGPMGEAISYALGQWNALTLFLSDARVPLDNNASERALRAAALGRKNWLFLGHDQAGENIAGLFSLIATCEANGINPQDYLTDVLLRVQMHPASRIDELLPHNWKPPRPEPSA